MTKAPEPKLLDEIITVRDNLKIWLERERDLSEKLEGATVKWAQGTIQIRDFRLMGLHNLQNGQNYYVSFRDKNGDLQAYTAKQIRYMRLE